MRELLLSTTILAAFLGGMVALLAPCCVSVMVPAYFAASFRTRTRIVAMTGVFALGVATVILPIGLDTATGRDLALRRGVLFAPGVLIDGELFSYGRVSEKKLRPDLARRATSLEPR